MKRHQSCHELAETRSQTSCIEAVIWANVTQKVQSLKQIKSDEPLASITLQRSQANKIWMDHIGKDSEFSFESMEGFSTYGRKCLDGHTITMAQVNRFKDRPHSTSSEFTHQSVFAQSGCRRPRNERLPWRLIMNGRNRETAGVQENSANQLFFVGQPNNIIQRGRRLATSSTTANINLQQVPQ